MDLKEERGAQNTIKKLIVDDKETTDQTHILEFIKESYETLLKNASKNLEQKLKVFLPDLISSQRTTNVKKRHIGESGTSISDVIEIAEIKKLEGFLVYNGHLKSI